MKELTFQGLNSTTQGIKSLIYVALAGCLCFSFLFNFMLVQLYFFAFFRYDMLY